MYDLILILLCALMVALVSVPLWLGVGRRTGIVVTTVLTAVAAIFVMGYGDLGGRRADNGQVTLVTHHVHGGWRS